MTGKINGRHPSPQVAHYMNTYQDVPLWVLITDLTIIGGGQHIQLNSTSK